MEDKYSSDARQLAEAINCTYADLLSLQQRADLVRLDNACLACNWIMPNFHHIHYGGILTIFRCADYFARKGGIMNRFLIAGVADEKAVKREIAQVFPGLAESEVLVLDSVEKIKSIPPSDFSIATLWTTAYLLLGIKNTTFKYYFIQDFEPSFYPAGSTHAQAELTYHFGFFGICNTVSLREIYERRYGGVAIHFSPCVDRTVFHSAGRSARDSDAVKRIFVYARPGHPRNGFELAMAAAKRAKARLESKIEIVCAGAQWNPGEFGLDGVVENLGLIGYGATADLYRSCHIGLVMMMTKHPSYIPLELMASGALVVTNLNPANNWLLKPGENCIVAPASADCLAEALAGAVLRYEETSRLRENARRMVEERLGDWDAEMKKVLDFVTDLDKAPPSNQWYLSPSELFDGTSVATEWEPKTFV